MSKTGKAERLPGSRVRDGFGDYAPQLALGLPLLEQEPSPGSVRRGLRELLQGELTKEEQDLVLAAARRVLDCKSQDERFAMTDPKQTGEYFRAWLSTIPNEVFVAVFLDTRHRVVAREILSQGTIDGAEVHPRVVVQRALQHNAAAMLVAHQHPSGCVEPSAADRAVTAQLKQALALVDVRLLDHFVVGTGGAVSLAMRGWV